MRRLISAAVLLLLLTPVVSAQGVTVRLSGDIVIPRDAVHDGSAVAMNGHIRVEGTLRGDALAMNGDIIVNGTVTGSVRTFNGNIVLGSAAVVQSDVWSANGRIDRAPGARVRGQVQGPVPPATPAPSPPPSRPQPWPDAWSPWWPGMMRAVAAWTMIGFIVLAAVVAAVFPAQIRRIADVLHGSPGESLLAGVGLWVVLPPFALVLALSIVGIPIVAFVPFIVMVVGAVGFAGVSQLIGDRLLGGFQQQHNTTLEAVVGAALLGVLAFIPGLGWLAIFLAITWGIGGVLVLILRRVRRPVQAPA